MVQAAATEELREAGQRKIAGFAERAAAAERQARDVAVRLRALESGQATLQVPPKDFRTACVIHVLVHRVPVGQRILVFSCYSRFLVCVFAHA